MKKFLSALFTIILILVMIFGALFVLDIVEFACPGEHVRSVTVHEVLSAPGCTESGRAIEKVYCTLCYHVISEKEVELPPKGHVIADGQCVVCGSLDPSSGLMVKLNGEGTGYIIVGPGSNGNADLLIPDTCNGLDIVAIADGAFENCTWLKTVTLPSGMYSIGDDAFAGCTELIQINMSSSISEVGMGAFRGCEKLVFEEYKGTDFTTYYLGNGLNPHLVLVGTDGYEGKGYSAEAHIHENTRVIAGGAFSGVTGLSKIVIPENVVTVGDGAFVACTDLITVVFGERLVTVGASAFDGCYRLGSLEMSNSVVKMGENVFRNCSNLTSVTLSSSMTVVSSGSFYGCTDLKEVNLTSGIKVIGSHAFEGCVIGNRAFYGCEKLLNVSTPATLTFIGESAFACCQSLEAVTLNNGLREIGDAAFSHCESLTTITVPASVTDMGDRVFEYCTSLSSFDD